MNLFNISGLILIWLRLVWQTAAINRSIGASRFLIYRTISVTQRPCNCSMSFSCSCCQKVTIQYTRQEKDLCVNFTYQRNGFNVDVSLSSDTISTRTITDYKAFQFCAYVPGCLFSTACVNILELNRFPKSITACLRLDIYAKKQLWQINYNCVSVSTELPSMPMNGTTRMINVMSEETSTIGQLPMTPSVTEVTSIEMMTVQTSEMNGALMTQMTE
ncbi:hypothetical protein HN011_005247 [Eciton burchellii]|nr:hypothetical protein HN011_005247 [Eciton burchellii]